MAKSIGELVVIIGAKTEDFVKGMDDADSKLGQFAKKAGIGMAAVGTAAAGAGIAAVKSFAGTGEQLGNLMSKTGMSAEMLSTLKYAAETSGSSLDAMAAGVQRMSVFMGDAGPEAVIPLNRMPGASALPAFNAVGPSEQTINLSLFLDGEQLFAAVDSRMGRRIRIQQPST